MKQRSKSVSELVDKLADEIHQQYRRVGKIERLLDKDSERLAAMAAAIEAHGHRIQALLNGAQPN